MGYIREDELIQFPNQDNGTPAMPGSYTFPLGFPLLHCLLSFFKCLVDFLRRNGTKIFEHKSFTFGPFLSRANLSP